MTDPVDDFNEGVDAATEAAAGAAKPDDDTGETDPETPVEGLPDDVPDGDVGASEPDEPAEGEKP